MNVKVVLGKNGARGKRTGFSVFFPERVSEEK
jgi:hypothetical protein